MPTKKVFIAIILAILAFFVWNQSQSTPAPTDAPLVSPTPSASARQVISYQGVAGKTALELLKSSHNVVTKTSSYGEYVESIDGIQGGTEARYWIVYVDGQMASVGAAELTTQDNQSIEWRFETAEENGTQ
jgi:hypothetical protein